MDVSAARLRRALNEVQRQEQIELRLRAGEPRETCVCCGSHTLCPWVVVTAATEGDQGAVKGVTGHWRHDPVCDDCHERPPGRLKGHFFERSQAATAARRAGSTTLGT